MKITKQLKNRPDIMFSNKCCIKIRFQALENHIGLPLQKKSNKKTWQSNKKTITKMITAKSDRQKNDGSYRELKI